MNILSSNSIAHKEPLCPMCFFPISLLYTGIGLHLVGRRLWLGLDYSAANPRYFPVISYRPDIFIMRHTVGFPAYPYTFPYSHHATLLAADFPESYAMFGREKLGVILYM